jgi:hypothetical protein
LQSFENFMNLTQNFVETYFNDLTKSGGLSTIRAKKKVCPNSIIPCSVTLFKSKLQTTAVTASGGSDIGSADVSG